MQHLELTLITADGRIGKERLSEPSTMVWSGGPDTDGETASATFELVHKGVVQYSFEIGGDDWRQLESEGRGVAAVWEGLQRGWGLEDAVYAAQYNEDPDIWDEETRQVEQELAQANAKLGMALAHLDALVPCFEVDELHNDYATWKAAADFIGYGS